MFLRVEELLGEIVESMKTTNKLLTQIEENLRVPNMIEWTKKIKNDLKRVID